MWGKRGTVLFYPHHHHSHISLSFSFSHLFPSPSPPIPFSSGVMWSGPLWVKVMSSMCVRVGKRHSQEARRGERTSSLLQPKARASTRLSPAHQTCAAALPLLRNLSGPGMCDRPAHMACPSNQSHSHSSLTTQLSLLRVRLYLSMVSPSHSHNRSLPIHTTPNTNLLMP